MSNLQLLGMIVWIVGLAWVVYDIGKDDGWHKGWMNGYNKGVKDANPVLYEELLESKDAISWELDGERDD